MAKQTMSKAEREFAAIMDTIPRHLDFEIAMSADTSTGQYADENTNIPDGMAMLVYGAKWFFYNLTEGACCISAISELLNNEYRVEIHRNTDHETVLLPGNKDLLFLPDIHQVDYSQNSGGEVFWNQNFPRSFGERTVSFGAQLRALFQTNVDQAELTTAYGVFVRLYFDFINAPSAGSTKLGRLADL